MNSRIFETWIETQLAPILSQGEFVISDNVGLHKSERAEQLVKQKGAARSFDAITEGVGDIISLFSVAECRNFFKAAGYEAEKCDTL